MRAGRYQKLINKLKELREELVRNGGYGRPATFKEIEEWADASLPPSAYTHRAWWSNNTQNYSNSPKPWDLARLSTAEVDMTKKTVVFQLWSNDAEVARKNRRPFDRAALHSKPHQTVGMAAPQPGLEDVQRPYEGQTGAHHPLRGALKGTIRIAIDVDLTLPADPEWGAEA